ncbi:hypothetical protein ACSMXM_01185 [Pacificimonas sp. ICDLI1SI03]
MADEKVYASQFWMDDEGYTGPVMSRGTNPHRWAIDMEARFGIPKEDLLPWCTNMINTAIDLTKAADTDDEPRRLN